MTSPSLPSGNTARLAMFNISMSEPESCAIFHQLMKDENTRFSKLAAIIQQAAPDILMLCEFDHPGEGGDDGALARFCEYYLANSQHGQPPIDYPYRYCPPSNTGLVVEHDLDGDGVVSLPGDAQGFGSHHGQFGFVLLSRYPIDTAGIRSWQQFLWQDMPDNLLPEGYFSPQARQVLRLSSKNHVLVPIRLQGKTLHVIGCHPTPPVFDGEEKRNARRNHDELRMVRGIIDDADWLYDDTGCRGGLKSGSDFVVMGDLNADRVDGDGMKSAISQLLLDSRINRAVASGRKTPKSLGGRFVRPWQTRTGRASEWTHIAGLRLDYVLPSASLNVVGSGVFWPDRKDPLRMLITDERGRERAQAGSDHRLVWVDIAVN
ncbi:endonuclease/exonuclease/phosphatase family protein [Photobacterium aquae]